MGRCIAHLEWKGGWLSGLRLASWPAAGDASNALRCIHRFGGSTSVENPWPEESSLEKGSLDMRRGCESSSKAMKALPQLDWTHVGCLLSTEVDSMAVSGLRCVSCIQLLYQTANLTVLTQLACLGFCRAVPRQNLPDKKTTTCRCSLTANRPLCYCVATFVDQWAQHCADVTAFALQSLAS